MGCEIIRDVLPVSGGEWMEFFLIWTAVGVGIGVNIGTRWEVTGDGRCAGVGI